MKLEINGFSIELTTDDINLSLKVSDASGKELSNNTYVQEQSSDVVPAEIPNPENTDGATPATTPEPGAEGTTPEGTTPTTDPADQTTPATESVFIPTLEEFKKMLKEGKIKSK